MAGVSVRDRAVCTGVGQWRVKPSLAFVLDSGGADRGGAVAVGVGVMAAKSTLFPDKLI